jgi:D-glucuronyl C5-epimerase-like protein
VSGGGWYFLYDFNFAPLGDTGEILRAPWYSGMAHGRALSVFVRLYQATRDPKWRTAADAASPASPGRRAAGSPTRPSWTVRRTCGSRSTRSPATLSERVLVKGTITTIKTPANSHHQMHVEQFPQLWQYTDDVLFITTANSYRGDYSRPATSGTMRATPRTSTAEGRSRARGPGARGPGSDSGQEPPSDTSDQGRGDPALRRHQRS